MTQRDVVAAVLCAFAGAAGAQPAPYKTIPVEDDPPSLKVADVEVTYGGFVKLDVLYSHFSDGDVPSVDAGRDQFRPLSVPIAGSALAEDAHRLIDFHAKDTRFFFKMRSRVAGHKLAACAWFASGLRTFDVSDPYHPKEYGYYIPPVTPSLDMGPGHNFSGLCESTDWILDQPRIRRDRNEIWFTSMCGGFRWCGSPSRCLRTPRKRGTDGRVVCGTSQSRPGRA